MIYIHGINDILSYNSINEYIDEISADFNVDYDHTEAIFSIINRESKCKDLKIKFISKEFEGMTHFSGLPHYQQLRQNSDPIGYFVTYYDRVITLTKSIKLSKIKSEIRDIKINKILNNE